MIKVFKVFKKYHICAIFDAFCTILEHKKLLENRGSSVFSYHKNFQKKSEKFNQLFLRKPVNRQ